MRVTGLDLTWLRKVPVAHRGLHDRRLGAPENSLAAFRRAMALGYALELDVVLTRDGEALVFHDSVLKRLTGEKGKVLDHDAAALTGLSILGTAEKVPRLSDVLALIKGRVPILVEVKSNAPQSRKLEDRVIMLLRDYRGPVAVQSFDPGTVAYFRRRAPDLARGQLSMNFCAHAEVPMGWTERYRLSQMTMMGPGHAHFAGFHVRDLPFAPVAALAARGIPVLAWTVRTARDRALARSYADNVIFENFRF